MRSLLEINLGHLQENYLTIRDFSKKEIIAVLKDNAYGHDLIHVGQVLSSLNVKMIAVATLEEAITLRKNLIFTPILLFERTSSYRILSNYRITIALQSLDHLKELVKANYPLSIHLELETGFNRYGILEHELEEALDLISHSPLLLKGIFTHYACEESYEKQKEIFYRVINKIPFRPRLLIHGESSRFITKGDSFTNAIRIGMALYGIHDELNLKPVMKLSSKVLRCKKITKGEKVSYNQEEVKEDGYILTLGIGYGDGWKLSYPTIGYYKNHELFQIGITNMDSLMLFSKFPISVGEDIELLGEHLPLQILLNRYQVSPYDFFSSLSYRITKVFTKKNS